jgi:hypothetical protein
MAPATVAGMFYGIVPYRGLGIQIGLANTAAQKFWMEDRLRAIVGEWLGFYLLTRAGRTTKNLHMRFWRELPSKIAVYGTLFKNCTTLK